MCKRVAFVFCFPSHKKSDNDCHGLFYVYFQNFLLPFMTISFNGQLRTVNYTNIMVSIILLAFYLFNIIEFPLRFLVWIDSHSRVLDVTWIFSNGASKSNKSYARIDSARAGKIFHSKLSRKFSIWAPCILNLSTLKPTRRGMITRVHVCTFVVSISLS